jgi:uncharacterized membrane protein YdbT with pleckstrin-like domain
VPSTSTLVVRRHPLTVVLALAGRVVFALLALAASAAVGLANPATALVIAVIVGGSAAARWARWRADTLVLAGSTMTLRTGVVVRSSRVIPVDAVQDVATERSLAGWLLGYGALELRLRAGAPLRLAAVPNPEVVRDRIVGAVLRGQRTGEGYPGG